MTAEFALLTVAVGLSALAALFAILAFFRAGRAVEDRSEEILRSVEALSGSSELLRAGLANDLSLARSETADGAARLRSEVLQHLRVISETVLKQSADMARQQGEQLNAFAGQLHQSAGEASRNNAQQHEAALALLRDMREHMARSLDAFGAATRDQAGRMLELQHNQYKGFEARLAALSEQHGKSGEALRHSLEQQLGALRQENGAKLEQMRVTVDEKLQGTLEQRLGESFKVVSDRLEAVHKGLGEMQTLASGVGDLKRVLTNVKARGSWGEVQLGALLEQMLTPHQYVTNACMVEGSDQRVEYAIRMPGKDEGQDLYLPIDAKFPIEDYERLQAAAERGDVEGVDLAARALESRLRKSAADICTKYVRPPRTTDFGIMFLPTEGLYAEAIRRPGLADDLQREHRVMIAGPTTLTAILNSLQMGFRTLAIQQRSSEVWQVLGAVKTEFNTFGDVLGRVKKKLQEATNHMDMVDRRSRAITRQLRQVEELPASEVARLLGPAEDLMDDEDADFEAATATPSLFLHGTPAE